MKLLALIVCLAMGSPVFAEDVSELIKQLDAETFQEREQAAQKLQAEGKAAIPALVKAANEGTLEAAVRAVEVLKALMESEDKPTAAEAKAALEKLTESEKPSTARRAKNALAPKPEPVPANANRLPLGGLLPVAPAVPANFAQRIRTTNNNGVKTVEAEQGDHKVKIEEDPNNGIKVEITDTQNGKPVTEKFEAKTADDLKKNHPKAYAEYEKYIINNAIAQRAFARPAVLPAFQRRNTTQLDMAGRLLQSLGRHVETIVNDEAIKTASNESRESLKKEVADMKSRLAELEKKLQSAIDADKNNKQGEAATPKAGEN